jgi:hypothetical protein
MCLSVCRWYIYTWYYSYRSLMTWYRGFFWLLIPRTVHSWLGTEASCGFWLSVPFTHGLIQRLLVASDYPYRSLMSWYRGFLWLLITRTVQSWLGTEASCGFWLPVPFTHGLMQRLLVASDYPYRSLMAWYRGFLWLLITRNVLSWLGTEASCGFWLPV